MDEIINSEIRIDELSTDTKKINIKFKKDKFSFWMFKKDGDKTKAYATWQELAPQVGDWIEVQFKEEDAEWEKDGKMIYFKRRTILNIAKASDTSDRPKSSPSASGEPRTDSVSKQEFEERILKMSAAFMDMAKQIRALKDLVEEHVRNYPMIK